MREVNLQTDTKRLEPCEDAISRQAAIDALLNAGLINYAATGDGNGMIHAVNVIKGLPSAQHQRMRGRWKRLGHFGRSYKCDQCGNFLDFDGVNAGRGDANYCPNCGADMRVGEQDEH